MTDANVSKPRIVWVSSSLFYKPEWQTIDEKGYYELVYVIEKSYADQLEAKVKAQDELIETLAKALDAECPCVNNFGDGTCDCGIQSTLSAYREFKERGR